MKNFCTFAWVVTFSIVSVGGTAAARDFVNDPKYAAFFSKGALKEGLICGATCLREKGKMYVVGSLKETDPDQRQLADTGAWYSFVNAHRMLDTAYKQGGVRESDKKAVAAEIRELDSMIMTVATKGLGLSKDQVSDQYNRTRQYLEAQIEQFAK